MKYYIHFSTIQPRFSKLKKIIDQLLIQSTPIEKIIISTSLADRRFKSIEDLNAYKTDKVIIQPLEKDYGASNKILGALKFYHSLENKDDVFIIICDDDNLLHVDTIKSYDEMLQNNKECIYTHYNTNKRIRNINHLQGADTYILNNNFLNKTTVNDYENYLEKIFSECPEAKFQDDYVISYYIHEISKIDIKKVDRVHWYNMYIYDDQMHKSCDVYYREKKTIEYFNNLP